VLRQTLQRWSLCIGGRGRGASAACWFVPECNKHRRADGNCCVDDCRENPRSFGAIADGEHQIAQRQEAHRKCTRADGCRSNDCPAVNRPGCSRPDGEGNAMNGREEGDRWHSSGTNLDDDIW
jgi:hypothetical protein